MRVYCVIAFVLGLSITTRSALAGCKTDADCGQGNFCCVTQYPDGHYGAPWCKTGPNNCYQVRHRAHGGKPVPYSKIPTDRGAH